MRRVLATAVVATVATIATLLGSPQARADNPVVNGTNLVSAPALGPGVVWWDQQANKRCSAGIPTHSGSTNIIVTAGHCGAVGNTVITDLAGRGGEVAGTITFSQEDQITSDALSSVADYGLMRVNDSIPLNSAVPGLSEFGSALTADDLESSYPDLCALGSTSGLTCGNFVRVLPNRTVAEFRANVAKGDSGGAVFAVTKQGQPAAVGTIIGPMDDDPTLVTVQLVAPILQQQGLSLGFV